MTEQSTTNHAWLLASRPSSEPTEDNFRYVAQPTPEIKDGEILLRTIYLSLDPYMRGRMDEGKSYAPPAELDKPMVGGTVCQVAESKTVNLKRVTGCFARAAGRNMPCLMVKTLPV